MNRDLVAELAVAQYGTGAEFDTADLIDFALHVLEEKARRDDIIAKRLDCLSDGHTFHWPGSDYQTGSTTVENSGVTVEGYKATAQQCQNCDAVLGLTYKEGVI